MSIESPYILIDADVLVIDRLPIPESRYGINRALLDRIGSENVLAGIPTQALFEVVGKWSYQTATEEIISLHEVTLVKYHLFPVPNLIPGQEYSGVTLPEIMEFMVKKMSLGDAIRAAQIKKFAIGATHLITWNAKHF